jgi:hypothetical protein
VGRVADVGGYRERGPAGGGDLVGELLKVVPGTGGEHHGGAYGGESAGSGGADAAAGPGDDRDLALQQAALAAGPTEACSVSI